MELRQLTAPAQTRPKLGPGVVQGPPTPQPRPEAGTRPGQATLPCPQEPSGSAPGRQRAGPWTSPSVLTAFQESREGGGSGSPAQGPQPGSPMPASPRAPHHPRGSLQASSGPRPRPAPEGTDLSCAASPPSRWPRRSWCPVPAGRGSPSAAHSPLSVGSPRAQPASPASGRIKGKGMRWCPAWGRPPKPRSDPGMPSALRVPFGVPLPTWPALLTALRATATPHLLPPWHLKVHVTPTILWGQASPPPGPQSPCHPSLTPQPSAWDAPCAYIFVQIIPIPKRPSWHIPASPTCQPSRGHLLQAAPLTAWPPQAPSEGAPVLPARAVPPPPCAGVLGAGPRVPRPD